MYDSLTYNMPESQNHNTEKKMLLKNTVSVIPFI